MKRAVMLVASLLLWTEAARATCSDPGTVASVRADAEAQCPCATAVGHATYVHCVAKAVKAAIKDGSLPKSCRSAVVKCARKSTCGTSGGVTCCQRSAKGTTKCSVKSSATKCVTPMGGVACVGTATSCCESCGATSCIGATTTTTAGGVTTTTMRGPRTHTVMVGPDGTLVFMPAKLTIAVGDTVRWEWQSAGHSVVSGTTGSADNKFCSPSDVGCDDPPLSDGGVVYKHTFMQAGTFPYYCSAHFSLGMTGRIVVQ